MTEIKILPISIQNENALLLPNEPFNLIGKLNVIHTKAGWDYEEEVFDETDTQVFPNENYQLEEINKNGFAIGGFDGNQCVGLAIFEERWNEFLYLADLKVNSHYRGQGIATQLLNTAKSIAVKRGCEGFSTVAQDNNLSANRFYLNYGFKIGGYNTMDYEFTQQYGKADIYYYYPFTTTDY